MKLKKLISALTAAAIAASSFAFAFPFTVPVSAADGENGIWAEYYTGKFAKYTLGRKEQNIDAEWTVSHTPPGFTGRENFSIRYTASLLSEAAGSYTFYSEADDGVLITLDGKQIISDDGPHFQNSLSKSVKLSANTYHSLTVEYYNGALDGSCRLYWQSPGKAKEIIPAENLFMPRPVKAELKVSGSKIYARASVMTEAAKSYKLIVEKRAQDGSALQSLTAERTADAFTWESEKMTYDKNCDYSAFAVDENGAVVSATDKLSSGIDAELTVNKNDESPDKISPLLYGACIEDVNHELYGGIWSQLIFGEGFAEPAESHISGFTPAGGIWGTGSASGTNYIKVTNQQNGPKLIINDSEMTEGEISADVKISGEGPAGFIIKVTDAKSGSDNFNGYEVGISNNMLRIGKHQYNYANIGDFPCTAPENTYVNLKIIMTENTMDVYVGGTLVKSYTDPSPLKTGSVGLRAWNCDAEFKNITVKKAGGAAEKIEIEYPLSGGVSAMWSPVLRDSAEGALSLTTDSPYKGEQSQRIEFSSGDGAIGVCNMSLNKKGINFEKGKEYEGYFYARSQSPVKAYVVAESSNGGVKYAESEILVDSGDWKKYSFTITPDAKDSAGRITIELRGAGVLDLGYVFLQPGEWGRFKGLPVRKDVAELLKEQGVTVLRFGGCMAQNEIYKWKNMISAPENRPTYKGWWYDYSSYGFGIIEFMDLCEKLEIVGIPDFSASETADDMADFIDYATGTDVNNEWVKKRIENGHPEPYSLPYIQFGNEEKVNREFAQKFNAAANKIWEKNKDVTVVAGDFAYQQVITDPYKFAGADSGITSLEGHKMILDNAAAHNRPVWFDIHIWTERTGDPKKYFDAAQSLYEQLKKLSPQAEFKLPVFELNANTHDMQRALTNAYAIIKSEQLSNIFPIVISANCLQVDGHNDNGWDQGLIFMNNDSAWFQPPAYVTQMSYKAYSAAKLDFSADRHNSQVLFSASKSEDEKTITVKAVNLLSKPYTVKIKTPQFSGNTNTVTQTVLKASSFSAVNTAEKPENVKPVSVTDENRLVNNSLCVTLEPNSYTTVAVTAKSENISPSSLVLSQNEKTIEVSQKFTLDCVVSENTDCDNEIIWSSTNPSAVSVNNGAVTGISPGEAVVTASLKNYPEISASCKVTVKAPPEIKVNKISLSAAKLTLYVNDSKQLTARVTPANAFDKTISYKSSNALVASVVNGKIYAKAPGKAVITASAGGKTASCTVIVNPSAPKKIKLTARKKALTLKFKKGAGAKYSKIVITRNGKKYKSKKITGAAYKFKASKPGVYKAKICCCKKVGKTLYSSKFKSSRTVKIKKSDLK